MARVMIPLAVVGAALIFAGVLPQVVGAYSWFRVHLDHRLILAQS